MRTNPDVLIIGGGLAGLAGAIHLSKKGLKVVLIEKIRIQNIKFAANIFQMKYFPIYFGLILML